VTGAKSALNQPRRVADLGHRAIREATGKASAIIQAFYDDRTRGAYRSDFVVSGRWP
jgi:hypothetical protein